MTKPKQTVTRKDEHIDICLREFVDAPIPTGLDGLWLEYDALPEMDLDEVDLGAEVLGRKLKAPLLIGAMTGGTDRAGTVNANLAEAAARVGVGLCLGSQRAMLEDESLADSYDVRRRAPGVPLVIGNLGAVQLNRSMTVDRIRSGLEKVSVDALAFHLNPLQEAVQPEGDTCFKGLAERLHAVVRQLEPDVPCLVKEVGAGISLKTARKLAAIPLAGIETAGVGGTSWALVEAMRARNTPAAAVGRQLASFGIPTALAIRACREAFGERLVIGSGGIRTGYQAAVALALGADAVAMARPLLGPATESAESVERVLRVIVEGLRVVMFCCGCRTPVELRRVRLEQAPMWSFQRRPPRRPPRKSGRPGRVR